MRYASIQTKRRSAMIGWGNYDSATRKNVYTKFHQKKKADVNVEK